MKSTLLNILLVLTLVSSVLPAAAAADTFEGYVSDSAYQEQILDKVEPLVLEELKTADQTDFFVWMTEKADLGPANQLSTKQEKGEFVFNTLRETAERTQKSLRAELDQQGVDYEPFYIANKILVRGENKALLLDIAARSDVAQITANHKYQLQDPIVNPHAPLVVESNISFVNADDVWALGVTGSGTVLAGNDTGLDWDHPALIDQYRGWNGATADHNYNWWDATGSYPTVPGDGHGHGTHTSGTMVGDDGGTNQIGMAPTAGLIHCKNMTDAGSGDDATFSTCFEWDLAPWDLSGLNPDPAMAPDAINNSWGYWGGNAPQFKDEIAALQAAGILVEVSAGNEGSACTTLRSPADYQEVLTTGSVNHAGGSMPGTLTDFSSRGPSLIDGDYFPDVMAPGENINSSIPGGGYSGPTWSGTSMAGPHVVGLIGLMWSANPGLRGQVDTTMQIIIETAVPLTGQNGSNCGGDYTTGPNNDWGFGTIDALAAVEQAMLFGGTGTLVGIVTDAVSSDPVSDATIEASLNSTQTWQTTSGGDGAYSMLVFSGTYTVDAWKYGYLPTTINSVGVISGTTTTLDIALTPATSYVVDGIVTDATTGWPLYASIDIDGYPGDPVWTDPVSGYYSVTLTEGYTYTFNVEAWVPGYSTESRDVGPLTGDAIEDFALDADLLACTAPGYASTSPLDEDFDPSGFPVDWTVVNNGGDCVWRDDNPSGRTNNTGGSDIFAVADSDFCGSGSYMDTELQSHAFDVSGLSSVILEFKSDYPLLYTGADVLDVDVFDGSSWVNVLSRSGTAYPGPETVQLDITAAANGATNAQVRFHYWNANWEYWWSVDDVRILGDCSPQPGGLAVGNVYDGNTLAGLVGADVENEDGYATTSAATPDDPAVDDGFYTLFSPAGSRTFTATMTAYAPDVVAVTVVQSDTVGQDFFLEAGWLEATPDALHANVNMGFTDSLTLTLDNLGGLDVDFEISEQDGGFQPSQLTIPRFTGDLPADTRPASTGRAPDAPVLATNGLVGSLAHLLAGEPAYALDVYPGNNLVYLPDTTVPGTWNIIGAVSQFHPAGDFLGGDFSKLYALDYATNEFVTIDTATGARTVIGTSTPTGNWSGMTGAPDGTLYAASANCGSNSYLYTIDPATGALTLVGEITGATCIIDIAINAAGEMYGVDIVSDELFQIDPTTGAGTSIGSLGADANYAQGMDFEEETGILYWAAYTTQGELRIIDTATGASTLVGAFPSGAEVDAFSFPTGGSNDVPWLSEDPISGTVPLLADQVIDVTFDASVPEITQPGDYYASLRVKNDTPNGDLIVPVTMTVLPPPNMGKLEGTVQSLGHCDANPYALEGAEVFVESNSGLSWTLGTDDAGYYIIWLDQGDSPYSVRASFPNHITETVTGIAVIGQQTTLQDFDLREAIPCASVAPDALDATLLLGDQQTVPLVLSNDGAADTTFNVSEISGPVASLVALAQPAISPALAPTADVTLVMDDGSRENAIGLTAGGQFVWLNRFTPDPSEFPFTLTEVWMYFGSTDGVNVGETLDIYVYEDTDGDGDPGTGATHLGSHHGFTIQALDDWTVETLDTPVVLYGPGDVLIAAVNRTAGTDVGEYPAAIDETATQTRSWIGLYSAGDPADPPTLPADSLWGIVDDFGFAGNWMIRGYGQTGTGGQADIVWLSEDPITGTVPADSVRAVDVTFTAIPTLTTWASYPVFTGTLLVQTDDGDAGDNGKLYVPVTMTISAAPFCGFETNSPVDVNETAIFTNTTLGDAPLSYEWDFGDGSAVSTLVDPTHVYATSGRYTVTLTADNPIGQGECSQVVEVNGPPVASFTDNGPIYLGEFADFDNTTTGWPSVGIWLWNFGASASPPSASTQDPGPVVFTAAGEHMISLTAVNSYGGPEGNSDTYQAPFTVCSEALTEASFGYPAAVVGQVVTFTAVITPSSVIPAPTVEWSFGGTGLEATHTFAAAGGHSVVMTVTNACDQIVYNETVNVAAPAPDEFFIFLPIAFKNQ